MIRRIGQHYVVYIGFLSIFLFFGLLLYDDGFLSYRNLKNIVLQTTPVAIMAVGLVFVLSAAEIDLSFGSIAAVSALTVAMVLARDYPVVIAVTAALGVAVSMGLVNGVLVAYGRLPSFLVTLATLGLYAGIARSLTDLRSIPVSHDGFSGFFGSGHWLGIPSLMWWMAGAVLVAHVVYRNYRFGAHVVAVGDNRQAARVAGVKVTRVRCAVFVLSGLCAGLAGMLYAGRLQAAKYTLGETDLMTAIAAVIIGGTLLSGGRGSVFGACVGALLMGMLNNGLILMGLSVSDQMIVRGGIILVAVAASLREKSNG